MISKELLSDVLGCNIKDIYKINSNPNFGNNELVYSLSGVGDILSINTYELDHKCKEWAKKKEFIITSETNTYASYSYVGLDVLNGGFIKEFEADTEPEAIFKACEWIMEQKK